MPGGRLTPKTYAYVQFFSRGLRRLAPLTRGERSRANSMGNRTCYGLSGTDFSVVSCGPGTLFYLCDLGTKCRPTLAGLCTDSVRFNNGFYGDLSYSSDFIVQLSRQTMSITRVEASWSPWCRTVAPDVAMGLLVRVGSALPYGQRFPDI
jgi:hypothetical protein